MLSSLRLKNLIDTAEARLGCRCMPLMSEAVDEMRDGKTVWKGQVETFTLRDHPVAKVAYAWDWTDEAGGVKTIIMPSLPPICTAAEAVKSAIDSGKWLLPS